ncbi:hypothetical protein EJ419_07235 [Alloscardovia theropitheci]|uniref:Uncharacterized protein n=1 Tax=Alloscardovia theropitheci TaxID=2496842 RepID=A0A4R0QNI0_9BIFI|nr:hypothetical protein [Alloscardovia theropitheci]TCD53752.1 hypothetical protein EJ419_07235 [Alloscardovia theropitheci]
MAFLDVIVLGTPITKGSYAPYTRNGKAINVDARESVWEAQIREEAVLALQASGLEPFDEPVSIVGQIRVPKPATGLHSLPAYQTAKDKGGGDLDKLLRAIGDALQVSKSRYAAKNKPGVITNDSRIVHWNIMKAYEDSNYPAGIYLTIISASVSMVSTYQWTPFTRIGRKRLEQIQRLHDRINNSRNF